MNFPQRLVSEHRLQVIEPNSYAGSCIHVRGSEKAGAGGGEVEVGRWGQK